MKHLKLFVALFAMLALGVTNAWAEEYTIGWGSASAREQEQRNEPPCDERVATVCDDRQEVGETPDENLEATVSDCDDFEETEDEGMAMSM